MVRPKREPARNHGPGSGLSISYGECGGDHVLLCTLSKDNCCNLSTFGLTCSTTLTPIDGESFYHYLVAVLRGWFSKISITLQIAGPPDYPARTDQMLAIPTIVIHVYQGLATMGKVAVESIA